MRKNIFNEPDRANVLSRLEKLTAETVPQWGKLKPNQMLRHVIEGNKITLGELQVPDRSSFFTRTIIRYFTLSGMIPPRERLEKNPIETFGQIDVIKQNIPAADFATEKANFIADVERIINATKFAERSPLIGKMSKENWGQLTYSHINYHFTQFGV
jgi:hypothetical protein